MRESYQLFLDDIRDVPMVYPRLTNDDFVIVRTCEAFIDYIQKHGLPSFISFDNDLGTDQEGNLLADGYAAAKWLVHESHLDLKNLKFNVHSANPVASIQIKSLLSNYIQFLKKT